MQAGLLNEIITIEQSTSERDKFGSTKLIWSKLADMRAWVRFKSGARKLINGEVVYVDINTINVRICKTITAKMRIVYNGQRYRITSLNHDRKQQATIMEVEVINE